jgi:hypothetical protein
MIAGCREPIRADTQRNLRSMPSRPSYTPGTPGPCRSSVSDRTPPCFRLESRLAALPLAVSVDDLRHVDPDWLTLPVRRTRGTRARTLSGFSDCSFGSAKGRSGSRCQAPQVAQTSIEARGGETPEIVPGGSQIDVAAGLLLPSNR